MNPFQYWDLVRFRTKGGSIHSTTEFLLWFYVMCLNMWQSLSRRIFPHSVRPAIIDTTLFFSTSDLFSSPTPVQEIYNAFTDSNKTLLFVLRFIWKDYIDVIEIYICSGDCDLSVVEELLTARLQSVQSAVCEETNLLFSLSLSTGCPKNSSW